MASNLIWAKWLPSWPTSAHWYDKSKFRPGIDVAAAETPATAEQPAPTASASCRGARPAG